MQRARRSTRIRLATLTLALLLAGCREPLYTGLTESDANLMRSALLAVGITGEKKAAEGGKWSLSVDDADVPRALQTLERAGLPRPRYGSTLDSIRTDALVPSASEDRVRLAHGLSQDLAGTIAAIDGVVSARVHLSIPDRPAFGQRPAHPPSASVFVRYRQEHNLQAMTLAIKLLVARSVEGLDVERVSVVTSEAVPVAAPEAGPQRGLTRPRRPAVVNPVIIALAGAAFGFGVAMLLPTLRRAWASRRRSARDAAPAIRTDVA